jgi:hypothetical protein
VEFAFVFSSNTYNNLFDLPENKLGQIIEGELIATGWPSSQHQFTLTALNTIPGSLHRPGKRNLRNGLFFIYLKQSSGSDLSASRSALLAPGWYFTTRDGIPYISAKPSRLSGRSF